MSEAHNHYFKEVTLGHFLSELPKSTLPASLATTNGSYPFFCSSSIVKYANTYLQDKPTVLMGTGGVASVNYGAEKFAYSTDTWAFRSSNEDELNTEYIYRVIQKKLVEIGYCAFEGSGLKHLRKEYVKKLKLKVPVNKIVNRRILSILSTIDQAIEKTEALIEKYQQIKAGLMHDLFTRGIGVDGKLRPPREQAPELYRQSPIGWIPKDWIFTTCENVCEKIIDCKNRTPPITHDGFPVIRTPNVRNGMFIDNELVFTDFNSYNIWTARGKPVVGDVVITREAPVGEVCKIPERHHNACLGQRMMLYRTNPNKVVNDYFLYALQSEAIQNRLDLISGGSTVGHVRVGDIRELWFFCPESTDEQANIAQSLNSISLKLETETNQLNKLIKQKSGLMHDLLTGNVQVPISSAEAAHV